MPAIPSIAERQEQSPALRDRFGRDIRYLRISVTDKCDLRCNYCMPKGFRDFTEPAAWLTYPEILRLTRIFAALGTRRVRITGGEPLTRKGLPQLIAGIRAIERVEDISLSTNGTLLAPVAADLQAAGLNRLNVSLDSLDRACWAGITGADKLPHVLAGLEAARAAGLGPVKVNMVLLKGVNEHEIPAVVRYCFEHGYILRLIEEMPMGQTGSVRGMATLETIRQQLVSEFGLVPVTRELGGGPARYWETPDGHNSLGFITPMSQHFCASCNRVRLASDGRLYLCLGQEHSVDLRAPLRDGCSDAELTAIIRQAIELKPEKHEFREQPQQIIRFMSHTGG